MKFNIRKISAIGASVLMAGLTLGTAMAANYPEPFVSGSTANAAIVYGTGSGVSDLDLVAANAIQGDLGNDLPATGSTSFSGGDVYNLNEAKDSDHFNFGDALNSIYSSLDDDEMKVFLQDGTYNEGDIDEEYDQKITLGTKTLTFFTDIDYNDKEPTLGFEYATGNLVLSYKLEYDTAITMTDMNDTKMPLMGREYYVLTAKPGEINLLDTAETSTLTYGDSVTVDSHDISIAFIDADEVMFTVDGKNTEKLKENEYEELDDGSYIVLTSDLYDVKEAGVSKAEFALGAGKVDFVTGSEVEINDEDVDGLEVTLTEGTAGSLDSITLTWDAYNKEFLTESSAFTMPGFETIKLAFGGLDFPSDPEVISIDGAATLTLSMGDNFDVDIMWRNATDYQTFGAEDYELVTAISTISNTTWTSPNLNTVNTTAHFGAVNRSEGLDLGLRDRIMVTRIDDDLGETEQYYWEVDKIENKTGVYDVRLDDLVGTADVQFTDLEEETKGDIILNLVATNATGTDARIYLNFTVAAGSGGSVTYDKIVSDSGLIFDIPASAVEGAVFTATEANRDGDLFKGDQFTLTVGNNSDNDLYIKSNNLTYEVETLSDDEYLGYVDSELATKVKHDKGPDAYDIVITYWGEEVDGSVMVASSDAEIVSEGIASVMVVKDSEVSSVDTKNLIVVGGSCINSAAAKLVGDAYCGDAWTTATGVGSGQFLIKSYASSSLTSEIALLVAGYEKDDTTNAANYLQTKLVDTSKSYISTSSTTVSEI